MLLPYWDYFIEKPWNYTLYPEALHTNIFCYGKPNSEQTEKIAIPVAKTAINENRSCIIYAEEANLKYKSIKEQALKRGYQLFEFDVAKLSNREAERYINKITNNIKNKTATLVIASNTNFRQRCQHTIIDTILTEYYKSKKPEPYNISRDRSQSTLFVLDGLCGNMILEKDIHKPPHLQFCIIMDSQIAYIPWLKTTVTEILENKLGPAGKMKKLVKDVGTPIVMQQFFYNIETIICTGVNGVKPEMHREFVGGYMFDVPSIRIGGRFIIMENPPSVNTKKTKSLMPSPGKKISINEETIENSTYSEIATDFIRSEHWILEQDGKPNVYFDGAIYWPTIFLKKEEALDWLALKIHFEKAKVLHMEQTENMMQCECFKDNTKKEFFLTRIGKEDEQSYQIAYLLRVLEMAEHDDLVKWLQTEEAITQGYDPTDGIEFNVQKYYENLKADADIEEAEAARKAEEANALPPIPPIEPYWKKFKEEKEQASKETLSLEEIYELPKDKVLFLGGHINMVKRIKQLHPKWIYITDDELKSNSTINVRYVFYWTNHSSHKMMENIFSRLTPEAEIIYVTATNMDRLENEMLTKFIENKNRKRRGAPLDTQQQHQKL